MITFTKEQLIASAHARIEFAEMMLAGELEPLKERTWSIELELARIALASLESEAVGYFGRFEADDEELIDQCSPSINGAFPLYAAPPAPVSVPDAATAIRACMEEFPESVHDIVEECAAIAESACRAAMLHGADTELQRKAAIHDTLCEKYNVESLEAFVDWQRNHIAELEAAPPAPVGPGETAVMPDYPGYTMTQRECYQVGKKAGLAELVKAAYTLPPHTYRELVNRLRDTAVKYQGCQQLREQLSRTLQEVIEPAAPKQEVKP